MRYAKIGKNDIANGLGVCVSFWTQGCHFRCNDCHNKETWDFNGGKLFTKETLGEIVEAIGANGVKRNLSILGGEPLNPVNRQMVLEIVKEVKKIYPNIKIYMWTGYLFEDIVNENLVMDIFEHIDLLIDGRFESSLKDITIKYAGSSNQRIIDIQHFRKTSEVRKLDSL